MATAAWNKFISIPNGTEIFNHGFNQCVALANHYNEVTMGQPFVPVPSAYMWWTERGNYSQIYNYFTASSKPVAGALFVARYGMYDAPNGHIGVVTKVHANGTFDTMEQNAGTWRYTGRYTRGMANMLGFLIPKKNPAAGGSAAKPKPKPQPVHEDEDEVKTSGFYYTNKAGVIVYLIATLATGAYHEYSSGVKGKTMPGDYNNPFAAAIGSGSFAKITESHAQVIKASCERTLKGGK